MSRVQLLSASSKMVLGAILLSAQPATAIQPLAEFVSNARRESFDAREQRAVVQQAHWRAEQAKGRLLPSFLAQGTYTRNQYEAVIPPGTFPGQTDVLTLTPHNQWDAIFRLDVPIVDLSSSALHRQAKHLERAAEAEQESTSADLDLAVARSYYGFIGASALLEAAEHSLKIAQENLDYVKTRRELGAATELDQERALANVERAKQDHADAEFIRITVKRNLETLSGVKATPVVEYPIDDLRAEAPLQSWLEKQDTPSIRVQKELSLAAVEGKRASTYALLPNLSVNAQERISNARGFNGQAAAYSISAVLSWNLNYSTYSSARVQAAVATQQSVRSDRMRQAVEDAVFNAYHRVIAGIAKSRSARARADSSGKAALLAMDRYRAGAATQLDVIQSQRDAFQAQAGRIKADADLFLARISLRLAAGLPPVVPASKSPAVQHSPALVPQKKSDQTPETKDPQANP